MGSLWGPSSRELWNHSHRPRISDTRPLALPFLKHLSAFFGNHAASLPWFLPGFNLALILVPTVQCGWNSPTHIHTHTAGRAPPSRPSPRLHTCGPDPSCSAQRPLSSLVLQHQGASCLTCVHMVGLRHAPPTPQPSACP